MHTHELDNLPTKSNHNHNQDNEMITLPSQPPATGHATSQTNSNVSTEQSSPTESNNSVDQELHNTSNMQARNDTTQDQECDTIHHQEIVISTTPRSHTSNKITSLKHPDTTDPHQNKTLDKMMRQKDDTTTKGTEIHTQPNRLHTDSLKIPEKLIGLVIGRKGKTIKEIKKKTNAHISITSATGAVIVEGENNEKTLATQEILKIIQCKEGSLCQDNECTFLHTDTNTYHSVSPQYIRAKVSDTHSRHITDIINIPAELRGLVVGKKGGTINRLRNQYNVAIELKEEPSLAEIRGKLPDVQRVKSELLDIITCRNLADNCHGQNCYFLHSSKNMKKAEATRLNLLPSHKPSTHITPSVSPHNNLTNVSLLKKIQEVLSKPETIQIMANILSESMNTLLTPLNQDHQPPLTARTL